MVIEHRVICESREQRDLAMDHHIGARLRALRNEQSLSAGKIAARLGIAETDYWDFERGHQPISARYLYKLCEVFEVPVTLFFEGYEIAGHDRPPDTKSTKRP